MNEALQTGDGQRIVAEARSLAEGLAVIQLHLGDAIKDWSDVHTEALREVMSNEQR